MDRALQHGPLTQQRFGAKVENGREAQRCLWGEGEGRRVREAAVWMPRSEKLPVPEQDDAC